MNEQKSFSNALKWAYTGNWGERGLSSLFVFILAGMLGPRDFGIAAIAITYVAFLQMFLDQGVAAALIQKKDLQQKHLDAVFWMDIVLSILMVAVSFFFSRWWAARNHAPEVAQIIPVLSLTIIIEAFSIVQMAVLKREMDFKSIAIRTNAATLISGIGGVGMAIAGYGVWSLVGQQILKDLIAVVLLWNMSSWRPQFEFSWKHLRELMGFSAPNFIAQLGIFTDVQAASIILGLLFGPVAVGLYRIADRIVGNVVTMAMASIQAVSFPEFSRLQDKPAELRKSVLTCLRLSSAVTLPALAGLAAVAEPLMATLGTKWIPAAGTLKLLAVLGMAVIFAYFTAPLLQALAKTRQVAFLEWGRTICGFAILAAAGFLVRGSSVNAQITGIALARLVTGVFLVLPIFVYILMRYSKISLADLLSSIAPAALSAASTVAAVWLFQYSGSWSGEKPIILLITETILGGTVGLLALLVLDPQLRRFARGLLQRRYVPPFVS
jgi:O-antigen/teichoic acid export membrane protein